MVLLAGGSELPLLRGKRFAFLEHVCKKVDGRIPYLCFFHFWFSGVSLNRMEASFFVFFVFISDFTGESDFFGDGVVLVFDRVACQIFKLFVCGICRGQKGRGRASSR